MRLPLAVSLTSRDGTLDKDPLITNGLVEGNKKVSVVRSRPGVTDLGLITAGTARLLACWNGLLSVIGSSLSSLLISAGSGTGSSVADTVDTSGNTITITGVSRFGDKFIVAIADADLEEGRHMYGSHSAGFASLGSPNVPSPTLGIEYTATNGSVVIATVFDVIGITAGQALWSSAVGATPTFTQVLDLSASDLYVQKVHYVGGRFVTFAFGGLVPISRVYWSVAGSSWSYYEFPSTVALTEVVYDGAYWWFYGGTFDISGTIIGPAVCYRTTDFVTFSPVTLSGLPSAAITQALYVNSEYLVVSSAGYTSSDGSTFSASTPNWLTVDYNESASWGSVDAGGGQYSFYLLGGASPQLLLTDTLNPYAMDALASSFCAKGPLSTQVSTITWTGTEETVTPTSLGTLVDALLSAEATGAAQSQQELMFKSAEQLWQYTEAGGLVLVTDIDYPGHHTYTASSVTRSSSVATFNTTATNALEAGMSVVVAGAAQTEYNGTHTIASIVDGDTFTYAVTGTPASPATGTITVYGGKTTVPGIIFLDGYFFVMTDKGVIFNSALGDGTSWNALDFVTAAEEPGDGVALGKSANYLVAFKEWSTEPFYDAGNATGSPISPVKSMSTRVGCASGSSLVDVDDKLIWISQTKDKGRSVHVMQGLQQQTPVATSDVERVLELDDLASVSAYGLRIAGHVLYVLTLHTSAITLVYDLTSGVWYQWTSLTADTPLSVSSMTRSGTTVTVVTSTAHGRSDGDPVLFAGADQSDYNGRFNVAVVSSTSLSFQVDSSQATTATGTITATTYTEGHFAYTKHVYCSGRHLLLHESNGHLYEFTDEVASDALTPIDLHCRTGKVDNGNTESKRLASLEVVGHKTTNGLALVRWTDDDYTSWSTYRSVDLEQEYSRIRRCGDFSRRAFELRYTGDAKVTLGALELDVKG